MPATFAYQFKVLLLGDMAVGKTSMLRRFVDQEFSTVFITTIGIDYKFKVINIGDTPVKLQIWDTAGQERFRTITTTYFRQADAIVLIYDTTDRKSFDSVTQWAKQIKKYADDAAIVKVLVGNKCDMPNQVVTEEEGVKLAHTLGVQHFLCSAKSNINVTQAFEAVVRECMERRGALAKEKPSDTVALTGGKAPGGAAGSSSCCS